MFEIIRFTTFLSFLQSWTYNDMATYILNNSYTLSYAKNYKKLYSFIPKNGNMTTVHPMKKFDGPRLLNSKIKLLFLFI